MMKLKMKMIQLRNSCPELNLVSACAAFFSNSHLNILAWVPPATQALNWWFLCAGCALGGHKKPFYKLAPVGASSHALEFQLVNSPRIPGCSSSWWIIRTRWCSWMMQNLIFKFFSVWIRWCILLWSFNWWILCTSWCILGWCKPVIQVGEFSFFQFFALLPIICLVQRFSGGFLLIIRPIFCLLPTICLSCALFATVLQCFSNLFALWQRSSNYLLSFTILALLANYLPCWQFSNYFSRGGNIFPIICCLSQLFAMLATFFQLVAWEQRSSTFFQSIALAMFFQLFSLVATLFQSSAYLVGNI